jgi:hypothetical protein
MHICFEFVNLHKELKNKKIEILIQGVPDDEEYK